MIEYNKETGLYILNSNDYHWKDAIIENIITLNNIEKNIAEYIINEEYNRIITENKYLGKNSEEVAYIIQQEINNQKSHKVKI